MGLGAIFAEEELGVRSTGRVGTGAEPEEGPRRAVGVVGGCGGCEVGGWAGIAGVGEKAGSVGEEVHLRFEI